MYVIINFTYKAYIVHTQCNGFKSMDHSNWVFLKSWWVKKWPSIVDQNIPGGAGGDLSSPGGGVIVFDLLEGLGGVLGPLGGGGALLSILWGDPSLYPAGGLLAYLNS